MGSKRYEELGSLQDPEASMHGPAVCLAAAVDRVVSINQQLPAESKIRVLSMSIGWGPDSPGYDAIEKAVKNATKHGILGQGSKE